MMFEHTYMKELKEIRGYQMITALWMILYSCISLLLVSKISNLIDSLTNSNLIWKDVLLFCVYLFLFVIVSFVSQYYFNKLPILGKNTLEKKLYSKMLYKDNDFFIKNEESQLSSIFQNDIQTLGSGLAVNPVSILYQSVTFLCIVCMMLYYHIVLTCLLFCVVFVCFFVTGFLSKKISQYNNEVFSQKNIFVQKITESIRAHSIVSMLYKENVYESKFNKFVDQSLQKTEYKQSLYQAFYITIYIVLSIALPLGCMGLGILFVYFHQLTIGKLLAMYALITQAQEPIRQLAELRTANESMKKLSDCVSVVFCENSRTCASKEIDSIDTIDIKIDSFGYDKTIIQELNYTIHKKDKVWIAGQSGCGKTTLMNLLMGFIRKENTIYMNGMDICEVKDVYKHMLLVNQTPYIFDASIYDNITMYDSFSDDEFNEVVSVCQLKDLLDEKGKDYLLKSSLNISGGQAQRICLARMLIRKPDVILLDEPTSALDENTSLLFTSALKNYLETYDITLLVVSHKKDITSICTRKLQL